MIRCSHGHEGYDCPVWSCHSLLEWVSFKIQHFCYQKSRILYRIANVYRNYLPALISPTVTLSCFEQCIYLTHGDHLPQLLQKKPLTARVLFRELFYTGCNLGAEVCMHLYLRILQSISTSGSRKVYVNLGNQLYESFKESWEHKTEI